MRVITRDFYGDEGVYGIGPNKLDHFYDPK